MTIKEEIVSLIDKLVRFRTIEGNYEEKKRCTDFIEGYFRGEDVFVKRYEKNDVPSIYVSLYDTKTPTILLNAHYDVVPAIENLFSAEIRGNNLIGRGVIDDKGPLAILMVLVKVISRMDEKPNIALLVTGDEETGGRYGVPHILDQGISAEFALVADGGSLNKYVTRAKGILQLKISARGIGAHGSRPWEGVNAIERLIETYSVIKEEFVHKDTGAWERTINLATIKGGDAPNKLPETAEMLLDIRYTDYETPSEILDHIKGVCEEVGGLDVEVLENAPVFISDEENPHIQALMDVSEEVCGQEAIVTFDHGGSDARFFSEAGIPSVVTNPLGGNHHSNEEYLDLDHVNDFYEIVKKFILRVCSTEAIEPMEFL